MAYHSVGWNTKYDQFLDKKEHMWKVEHICVKKVSFLDQKDKKKQQFTCSLDKEAICSGVIAQILK